MAAFVEHFRSRGALVAVERCLLHLEIGALDFDMITGLLQRAVPEFLDNLLKIDKFMC